MCSKDPPPPLPILCQVPACSITRSRGSSTSRTPRCRSTSRTGFAATTGAKILLCDADLDHLGRNDFLELDAKLREGRGIRGVDVSDDEKWFTGTLNLIKNHKFYTQSRNKLREEKKHHLADLKNKLKDKLEEILNEHTLHVWYPKVIDKINGGYYTNYSYDWNKEDIQNKFIVTQARHVWTLSKAFEFYPERKAYLEFANHGYEFLKEFMWDKKYGGFFQLVDSAGQVPDGKYMLEKRVFVPVHYPL